MNFILEARNLDNDLEVQDVNSNELNDKKYSYDTYLNSLYLNKEKLSKKFVIDEVTYKIKYNKQKGNSKVKYTYDITNESFNLSLSKSVSDVSVHYTLQITKDNFKIFYDWKDNCNIIVKDSDSYIVYSNVSFKFFEGNVGFRKTIITESS